MRKQNITAGNLLMSAPPSQLARAQLVYRSIAEGRFHDAIFTLIDTACQTRGSAWAQHALSLAEYCIRQIDRAPLSEQKAFIAGLLDLHGKRLGADHTEINAAAYLASVHLDHGYSASGSLSEGYKCLRQLRQTSRVNSR